MDEKERKMLGHYKTMIERRLFDEYDILGFLIFIRRHLHGNYNYIEEFANTVAHRKRDTGIIFRAIVAAKRNNYKTKADGKTVENYCGMKYETWQKQWMGLGKAIGVAIDKAIVEEITLCVFSMMQHVEYDDGENMGTVDLFQNKKDGALALVTSENSPSSSFVCFAKYGKYDYERIFSEGIMRKPVETVRENGKLRLRDEDGYII